MGKNKGFGVLELLVVIGAIAVISAIATPSVLTWRAEVKLRSAAQELRAAVQLARSRAIQEGKTAIVNLEDNSYLIFVDSGDGSGGLPNWYHNPPEPIVSEQQLPAGIQLIRNVTPVGDPAPPTAPPGTAVHHQLMQMTHGAVARGDFSVAGSLLTVADFEEQKVHFAPSVGENKWQVWYDGVTTGLIFGPPDIYPDQLVFDHKGRCLNPQFIIMVHVNGQKMRLEVARFGVAKLAQLGVDPTK